MNRNDIAWSQRITNSGINPAICLTRLPLKIIRGNSRKFPVKGSIRLNAQEGEGAASVSR
ncbi:hypothetical protein SAMN03159358_2348 [Paenibacillus sp. NFR01]|nr:hypothetical protein SAMN03159358_2348 [Paenibacillus sp. NFR01]